jgi:hypothetical protein
VRSGAAKTIRDCTVSQMRSSLLVAPRRPALPRAAH